MLSCSVCVYTCRPVVFRVCIAVIFCMLCPSKCFSYFPDGYLPLFSVLSSAIHMPFVASCPPVYHLVAVRVRIMCYPSVYIFCQLAPLLCGPSCIGIMWRLFITAIKYLSELLLFISNLHIHYCHLPICLPVNGDVILSIWSVRVLGQLQVAFAPCLPASVHVLQGTGAMRSWS